MWAGPLPPLPAEFTMVNVPSIPMANEVAREPPSLLTNRNLPDGCAAT
jgi:hypothetical protein